MKFIKKYYTEIIINSFCVFLLAFGLYVGFIFHEIGSLEDMKYMDNVEKNDKLKSDLDVLQKKLNNLNVNVDSSTEIEIQRIINSNI